MNLYIAARGKEAIVPLSDVVRIDMLGSGRGSRGVFYNYEVSYTDAGGNRAWFYLTIYWKKNMEFEKLINMARVQNPALEVKTFKTAIDGLIKFFSKKKQAV